MIPGIGRTQLDFRDGKVCVGGTARGPEPTKARAIRTRLGSVLGEGEFKGGKPRRRVMCAGK